MNEDGVIEEGQLVFFDAKKYYKEDYCESRGNQVAKVCCYDSCDSTYRIRVVGFTYSNTTTMWVDKDCLIPIEYDAILDDILQYR